MNDLASLLAGVTRIVRRAGDLIADHNTKPRDIRHKGRIDLVTGTDLAVEAFLKENLSELLPGSSFLAEESAADAELTDNTWIIDPVDGTTNFAHGLPVVATSVGLWRGGEVVLGVVNAPLMQECFTAFRGGGAYLNDAPIKVSDAETMQDSLVATGFPYAIEEELPGILRRLQSVLPACQGVRRWGAAALDLAYVAAGRYDAFYELRLNPWDVSAGWLLVQEAGGHMTRMNGAPYHRRAHDVLATNGRVHETLRLLLNEPEDSHA